jgi:endonuclease/exonuclease/phosphatase family metal-dependent hydrolase
MSNRIRVVTYNIHKGFSARNQLFILKEIREELRKLSPDFVFLQEVIGEHHGHRKRIEHWPDQAQFEYLAHELWPHYIYGKNAIYKEGHHGNAILSKHPISFWENEDISTNNVESRGILHATLEPGLHLICTHFGLFERDRQVQAKRLCERIKRTVKLGDRLIVAGDFNDWTLSLTKVFRHEIGLEEAYHVRHKRHARTFPARIPILRLDRIYFHGLNVKHATCLHSEPWSRLSDHAVLTAEFESK